MEIDWNMLTFEHHMTPPSPVFFNHPPFLCGHVGGGPSHLCPPWKIQFAFRCLLKWLLLLSQKSYLLHHQLPGYSSISISVPVHCESWDIWECASPSGKSQRRLGFQQIPGKWLRWDRNVWDVYYEGSTVSVLRRLLKAERYIFCSSSFL